MLLFTYYTYYIIETRAIIEINVVPAHFLHGYYNLLQPTTFFVFYAVFVLYACFTAFCNL